MASKASSVDVRGFFDAAVEVWQQACVKAGGVRHLELRVAGRRVRLCFAGPALLERLGAVFGHLQVEEDTKPELRVLMMDGASTEVELPVRPWDAEAFRSRGEIEGVSDGPLRLAFEGWSGGLSGFDPVQGLALYWLPSAVKVTVSEVGSPLRLILHWWSSTHGLQLAHSAAVGTQSGGVLLVGAGGSGKSTTALACLLGGMRYAADDYCVVGLDPQPVAHSLYASAKLWPAGPLSMPFEAVRPANAEDKSVFHLHPHLASRLVSSLPLRAIVLPRVSTESRSRLRPASAALALAALAPSTLFSLPHAGAEVLGRLAGLARRLPCYRLELGRDIPELPGLLAGLAEGRVEA